MRIEFYFVDGDWLDTYINNAYFITHFLFAMTQDECDQFVEKVDNDVFYGPFVMKLWELCKRFGVVDFADARIPAYMIIAVRNPDE